MRVAKCVLRKERDPTLMRQTAVAFRLKLQIPTNYSWILMTWVFFFIVVVSPGNLLYLFTATKAL